MKLEWCTTSAWGRSDAFGKIVTFCTEPGRQIGSGKLVEVQRRRLEGPDWWPLRLNWLLAAEFVQLLLCSEPPGSTGLPINRFLSLARLRIKDSGEWHKWWHPLGNNHCNNKHRHRQRSLFTFSWCSTAQSYTIFFCWFEMDRASPVRVTILFSVSENKANTTKPMKMLNYHDTRYKKIQNTNARITTIWAHPSNPLSTILAPSSM